MRFYRWGLIVGLLRWLRTLLHSINSRKYWRLTSPEPTLWRSSFKFILLRTWPLPNRSSSRVLLDTVWSCTFCKRKIGTMAIFCCTRQGKFFILISVFSYRTCPARGCSFRRIVLSSWCPNTFRFLMVLSPTTSKSSDSTCFWVLRQSENIKIRF